MVPMVEKGEVWVMLRWVWAMVGERCKPAREVLEEWAKRLGCRVGVEVWAEVWERQSFVTPKMWPRARKA